MLNIQEEKKHESEHYQAVLDVLTLQGDTEYNDLWEEILTDINMGKEKPKLRPARIKIKDEEFDEAIERLIKEGEEEQDETEPQKKQPVVEKLPEDDGP